MRLLCLALAILCVLPATVVAKPPGDPSKEDGFQHAFVYHSQGEETCTLRASGGDDGPAFIEAAQACDTIIIPKDTTLSIASPLNMTGIVDTHISLEGTVKFVDHVDYWAGAAFYFEFQNSNTFWVLSGENILLDGGGTIDGSGQVWWDTHVSNSSLIRPMLLIVHEATNVTIQNITQLNSPKWFNFVHTSQNVVFDNLNISAVSTSTSTPRETDGWDVYRSDHVSLTNSIINNGDDCVAWKPNCTNMFVANLTCHGSHGISVGSLGQYPEYYDIVENVTATNITLSNCQFGARIKTFAGANVGSGIVKNVTFELFFETAVDFPIIIDQCYKTNATECSANPSNTYIEDIWFNNITGTSSGIEGSTVAFLDCSPDNRCRDINVKDLSLSPPIEYGAAVYECQNVDLTGDAASLFNCTTT